MDSTFWATEGGWITAIVTVIVGGAIALWPKKGTLEHQLIDQLQEEVTGLRTRVDAVEAREVIRERYVRVLEKRDQAWSRYHTEVAIGVEKGSIPPMPPLPAVLMEDV